ncbi:winged helix-turn-helix domain-containing protein [Vibrio mediterranei]
MKNQKIQFTIDDWVFIPSEDKFILDDEEFIIDHRLSRLFHFLCDNPYTVFSRDELINEVWNGSILTDQVITQAIFELRKILKQHGSHPFGYIVTVPKRGYKLDADVERKVESPAPVDGGRVGAGAPSKSENPLYKDKTISSQAGKTSDTDNARSLRPMRLSGTQKPTYLKHWAIASVLLLCLVPGIIYLVFINGVEKEAHPASTIAPSYLSFEPRYIYVKANEEFLSDHLKVGMARKLLDYLKIYRDYRIIYDGPAAKVAANELRFSSIERGGHQYLEIEYFNRVSGDKHLDRRYKISQGHVKAAIKKSLTDLLESFNISVGKSQVASLVDELPDDENAVSSILESLGAAFQVNHEEKALQLIELAAQQAPENQYTIATAYMFILSKMYIKPDGNNINQIEQLNQKMQQSINQFSQDQQLTPRLLEAMSMMEMSKDEPYKAKQYLTAIPYDRRSIMFYIISAKVAESTGNTSAAEEFYYHAILEASTVQVLNLSETLFFYSDLSDIRDKITNNVTGTTETW